MWLEGSALGAAMCGIGVRGFVQWMEENIVNR